MRTECTETKTVFSCKNKYTVLVNNSWLCYVTSPFFAMFPRLANFKITQPMFIIRSDSPQHYYLKPHSVRAILTTDALLQ